MNDFLKTGTLSQEAEAIVRSAFEKAIDEVRMFNYTQKEFDECWETGHFRQESIAAGVYQYLKKDVSKKILSVQLIKKNSKEILCQRDAFFNVLDVMHKNGLFMGKCVCEVRKVADRVSSPLDEFVAADYDEMRSRIDHDIFDAQLGLMKPVDYSLWYDIQSDNASLKLWLKKDGELKITGEHESISWLCLNSIRINRFRELQSTNTSAANLVRDTIFDRVIVKYYNDHREGFIRDLCAKKYKKDKKRERPRRVKRN